VYNTEEVNVCVGHALGDYYLSCMDSATKIVWFLSVAFPCLLK